MRVLLSLLILCSCVIGIAAAQITGERRVAVFVVTFQDSPPPATWVMPNAQAVASENDALWAEQSYGQFTTRSDVFGIYTLPLTFQTASELNIKSEALNAAQLAGVDLSPYTGWVFVSPISAQVSGGVGNANGVWIATNFDYPQIPDYQVLAHELGHHLHGLPHAHGYQCNDLKPIGSGCQVVEYGNKYDVMGSGYGHFNASVKAGYGWLTADGPHRVQTVTASGDYLIEPLETPNGIKALQVVGSSNKTPRTYWLEYRRPIGFDARQTSFLNYANAWSGPVFLLPLGGTMLLHMTPDQTFASPALPAGATYCDRNARISIQTLAATATGTTVRIQYGNCK